MSKRRQRDFFESDIALRPGRLAHGGELAVKRRKIIRPLDPRRPVHITMRSTRAKGRYNFRNHQLTVKKIIETAARRSRVKLHKFANVGNHLHILVSFKSRESCQRFMRRSPRSARGGAAVPVPLERGASTGGLRSGRIAADGRGGPQPRLSPAPAWIRRRSRRSRRATSFP